MPTTIPICYLRLMGAVSEALFYRRLHTGNPGDIEFYQRAAKGARSILELGCGWGRVSLPLAQSGYSVLGIDQERLFLEEARNATESSSQAEFMAGDIRTFSFPRSKGTGLFERIFIAYNTLYSLGGQDGVRECLKVASQHLAPNGELWLDIYPMDEMHEALLQGEDPGESDDEPVALQDWDGTAVRIFETSTLHPEEQYLEVLYRALDDSNIELARLSMKHHYLLTHQLIALLEEAGLTPLGVFGNFEGAPLDENVQQIIVGAQHQALE